MNKTIIVILTLCLSFLIVLFSAISQTGPSEPFVIHYDAPFWIAAQCFCAQWLTVKIYNKLTTRYNSTNIPPKLYTKVFMLSSILFVALLTIITTLIELVFDLQKIDKPHVLLSITTLFLLHAINGGAVISLKLIENLNQQKLALERADKALTQSKLKQIKQQLDPHFLFNNLNILSGLISSKPEIADLHIETFSDIYRYILDCQDLEKICLSEEISFATNYIYLLNLRFANAYKLNIDCSKKEILQHMTLPCSLQLALENVIKHNKGDLENPLTIQIEVSESWLDITNKIRPKLHPPLSKGLGLTNLKTRASAILGKPIEIIQTTEEFKLRIPVVHD